MQEKTDKHLGLAGKRLLILGGAVQCLKVVDAAKEMGVYTIVTDVLKRGPAKLAADEALPYSVTDTEAIIDWCRNNPVDGVLNYCIDYAQDTHQRVCEELKLPSYGTAEQYRILTDKTLFKRLCRESNVGVIQEYYENDLFSVKYPVLVKPAQSSGSRSTCVCYNLQELKTALDIAKNESKNHQAIIEKYMYGCPDFSMSYVVIDGEPYLTRTLDRYVGRPEDNLQRQCICARCPSIHTGLYMEKAHDNVCAMLKKIGLKNAAVFMQGFVDGDEFRFYDPAIRFSGSEYERMLKAATGIDMPKAFIAYALGQPLTSLAKELKDAYKLNGKCGLQLFITSYPGQICSVNGVNEIAAIPDVVAILQKHELGYCVPDSGDVKQRIFEIIVLIDHNKASIGKCIDQIDKFLSIKDRDDNELKTPIIKIERMIN